MKMNYTRLSFRRQFLFTTTECLKLGEWKHNTIDTYNLYVHPDLDHYIVRGEDNQSLVVLIGYIINPEQPEETDHEIVTRLCARESLTEESIARFLYPMSGRFVLIVKTPDKFLVFHDCCGLRTVFFANHDGYTHIASDPLLLGLAIPLIKGKKWDDYQASIHKKENDEHWIPAGGSLYDNVFHLIPNHYLNVSNSEQIRFWPNRKISAYSTDEASQKAALILSGSILAASKRFKLALPLTAGWDSRAVLAASRHVASDLFLYTLQYGALTSGSYDLRIPAKLLSRLGYEHHLIECGKDAYDEEFMSVYMANSAMAHFFDWGKIAFSLYQKYPSDMVCLKGAGAGIVRCNYYSSGKHDPILNSDQLLGLVPGWDKLSFVRESMEKWFIQAKEIHAISSYDILDLFCWEQRVGNWQSQSQVEWDIALEQFTPFSNRELLDTLLGVKTADRCYPGYIVFEKMIVKLWPEVMKEPINPSFKGMVKNVLSKFGVLDLVLKFK